MNLTFQGNIVYAITGGVQIDSVEVLSLSMFNFPDIAPSMVAQLRDPTDTKPIWTNTLFGTTLSTEGKLIPSNDNQPDIPYKLLPGYIVNIQEVTPDIVVTLFSTVSSITSNLKMLELYNQFIRSGDISTICHTKLLTNIANIWTSITSAAVSIGSLEQGGANGTTTIASGIPYPGSFNYSYDDILGFGDLSIKLVSI